MIRNLSFGVVAVALGLLALPGCPGFSLVCEEGPCGTDGGLDGTLPDGDVRDTNIPDAKPDADPIPTDCTTPTDPTKNPEKCLVDSFGVFVSPTGDDAKDGSKANPFKTIGKALGTSRSRIVVCEGEYTGSLDVGRAVEIYGGVSCDFAKPGAKAKVVATKAAYGIKVSKVTAAVVLADLDVVGMNAAAPSESSVGIFATESADLKLLRSRAEAGDGADAPAKKDGAFAMGAQAPKGGDAVVNSGGASATSGVCPGGGTSIGGKGGDLGFSGDDGAPRPPGGAKGPAGDCTTMGTGFPGTPGTPGMDRTGASSVANLTPDGIAGSKGQDGSAGSIGGGGGGGYGTAGAGGAGGAGGCGGQGGFGGAAGGSSVALLVFASEVSIEGTELVAKNAKPGGAGGSGQPAQMGGFRGTSSGGACNGGNGAAGGNGGNAGGGAGGIAAGIVWSTGKEPKRDAATKITRPTAAAPVGGEGGGGAATKGIDGVHADAFEVK